MKKILKIGLIIIIIVTVIVLSINFYVILSTKKQILKDSEYSNLKDIDCILVLGAGWVHWMTSQPTRIGNLVPRRLRISIYALRSTVSTPTNPIRSPTSCV